MNIIKKIRQLFCNHEKLETCPMVHYYKPDMQNPRGEFFEYEGLKCKNCGKLFN